MSRYWKQDKVTLSFKRIRLIAAICAALGAQACAVMPNTISPEFVHMSHATQHAPLTNNPTNYGVEIVQVNLHWELPKHFHLDVAEGIALDKRDALSADREYGEIVGPREQFTAKIGYSFRIH